MVKADKDRLNRRGFLKRAGMGAMGIVFGGEILSFADGNSNVAAQAGKAEPQHHKGEKRRLYKRVTEPARVSLVKGNDRREIVYQSLKMIEDEILGSIGDKQILIKPNMVQTYNPLCATHVDAVRAILDFLKPHSKRKIMIGESTAGQNTFDGFKNYKYLALEKEYDVKLIDLNLQGYEYRYVFGKGNRPLPIRIISTFLNPNVYIISAARMKTHDRVLVTLSLKNVIMASPINDYKKNDKGLAHTGQRALNTICHYNLFHLAQQVYPDLAVIDGFVAMEGDGPVWGSEFDSRVAIASRDALAADTLATKVMGFDPKRILYLSAMTQAGMGQGDIEKINVLGSGLDKCLYHFKPEKFMAQAYNL